MLSFDVDDELSEKEQLDILSNEYCWYQGVSFETLDRGALELSNGLHDETRVWPCAAQKSGSVMRTADEFGTIRLTSRPIK